MVEAVRGNSSYGWTVQYALSYDDYYADASVRMMVQTMPIGFKWHQSAHFFWKDFTGASLKFIESKQFIERIRIDAVKAKHSLSNPDSFLRPRSTP
jgi:hypothetical protein